MRVWMMGSGLLMTGACNGAEPETRQEVILSLSGDPVAGMSLYDDKCSVCHAADGSGGIGPDIRGAGSTVSVMLVPPSGMTDFSADSDQDIADVAAYVDTL